MYGVWTAVKVVNSDHERVGQVGVVWGVNRVTHPDDVIVKFDQDGQEQSMPLADIQAL
jgi:hypothetical protein